MRRFVIWLAAFYLAWIGLVTGLDAWALAAKH